MIIALSEQARVLGAALGGAEYSAKVEPWNTTDAGERTLVDHDKGVQALFFLNRIGATMCNADAAAAF